MLLAPAKINLALHVTGQRADGYHLLDSLVVFADTGDRLSLSQGTMAENRLALSGPYGGAVPAGADNLALRALALIGARGVVLHLDKRLPPASGMGGGTADAAAALRLAAAAQGLSLPDRAAQMGLGADLAVCLAAPHPARMQGLGEQVSPLPGVPALWLVIANPGQPLPTPQVFKALNDRQNPGLPPFPADGFADAPGFAAWLAGNTRNDLQPPASALMPTIPALLDRIARQPGCMLARMTGSGATCFGVFDGQDSAERAARALARALAAPGHFVTACRSQPSRA